MGPRLPFVYIGEAIVLERKLIVGLKEGLHARPATQFVKLARGFSANLEIVREGISANAKSAVKLMLLGVKEGDEISIRADGEDAVQALQALGDFAACEGSGAPGPNQADAPAPQNPEFPSPETENLALRGAPASEGCGIGPVFAFFPESLEAPRRAIAPHEIDGEIARLHRALAAVEADLARRKQETEASSEDLAIAAALGDIGRDEAFLSLLDAAIRAGQDAVSAALGSGASLARQFEALEDPYLRARGEDLRAIARQIALALLGRRDARLAEAPSGSVVIADEISAFDLIGAPLGRLAGLVCARGGSTSHVAIIARSHGLPAVLGFAAGASRLRAARLVALDGGTGEVALDPDAAAQASFHARIAAANAQKSLLQSYVRVEPRTRAGRLVEIAANIGSLREIDAARAAGAMGVGLFRTELLFMESKRPPGEDEQAATYDALARAFAPAPVIVRTLDIGGDKPVPGIAFPHEDNPFLGWRGVRFCLDRPDIFKPQLRALLRAAVHGNLKVMVPMVAEAEELRSVKRLLDECRQELSALGVPTGPIDLGVMIETPAAAFLADELAAEAAFFSIGTNDLAQYVMAADRQNPRVAHLNRADHPAVLRAIDMICRAALKAGIWVGICGEAAARPDLIPAFVAMGVSELSMSPASILRAKKCVTEI